MAAQSTLAQLGLRLGVLGSAASLAVAAPLANGNGDPDAATSASRIGLYFDRTVSAEKIGFVVMGTESMAVSAAGVAVSNLNVAGTLTLPAQLANTVFAGPATGAPAVPTFRALTPADLPSSAITGAVSPTQVVYGDATPNVVKSSANMTFDGTNLTVAGTIVASNGFTSPVTIRGDSAGTLVVGSGNTVNASAAQGPIILGSANIGYQNTSRQVIVGYGNDAASASNLNLFLAGLNNTLSATASDSIIISSGFVTATAINGSVIIGLPGATVGVTSVIVGRLAQAGVSSVGVGSLANASGGSAVAVGAGTTASANNSIAVGQGATNTTANSAVWGNTSITDHTFAGTLHLLGSTSGSAAIKAAAVAGTPATLTLPTTNGSAGSALTTDGAGLLSWSTAAGITGSIAAPQIAFGSGANTITGDANFVYTSTNLGLGTTTPTAKLHIVGNDLAAAADLSVATIFTDTTLTKNSGTTRTFYGSLFRPTFNTGGSNTTTTYNVIATDSVNTSVTGLTVNLLNLSYGGVNALLVDSSGKTTLPRSGTGTGDFTMALTGTPVANATSSQLRLGNALVGGNSAANGGTYFSINLPSTGAGSAADIEHFQVNGVSAFRVQSNAIVRINNTTDDATGAAQLSVTSAALVANAPCLFVDNGNDVGATSSAIVVRTKGNVGASRVFCVRNLDHATQFTFTIGSLGAMSWGTGDSARDVGLSRSTTVANALAVDGGGSPGNFLVSGFVGIQTGTLNATAAMSMTTSNLSTAADQAPSMMAISGTAVSKNDSNTRQFFGIRVLPTFNTGVSNLNTTYNVINVDTINTSVTGLTVNLLNLAFGGSTKATVASDGAFTALNIKTEANGKVRIGNVDLAFPNQVNTVVITTGSANQASDNNVIILGNGSVQSGTLMQNAILMGGTISTSSTGTFKQNTYVLGANINVPNLSNTITLGIGVSSGSRLAPVTSSTISFGINSTVPTMWIGGAAGAGTFGQVVVGTITADATARLTVAGTDLTTAATDSVANMSVGATLTKNDANTRTFFGSLFQPTFNTGGSNTTTTYNILAVDSVNTSVIGLTVNLLNLAFGGSTKLTVLSTGATTFASGSLTINTVPYAWPAAQGAASTVLTNDGAGNLSWTAAGGGGTIGGTAAAGRVAFGSGVNTITSNAGFLYDSTTQSFSSVQTVAAGSGAGSFDGAFFRTTRAPSNTNNVSQIAAEIQADLTGAGAANPGTSTAVFASGLNNMTGGSIAAVYGVVASVQGGNSGSTTTVMAGLKSQASVAAGHTVSTFYSLWLPAPTISGTVTTHYGVYQESTAATNFFGGIVGVGNATPSTSTALIVPASTTGVSSLRVPHGVAPSAPVNGDIWTTATAMFVQINGSTVQLGSGGGTIGGSITQGQVAFGAVTANSIAGSSNFTWSNTDNTLLIQAPGFTASTGVARVTGTLTGSAGNHYIAGLSITLDNAQTGGSNNSIDGLLTNVSCTGSGTSNNSVNGVRTIVSLPTGQNTSQVSLFNGSLTTSSGSTYSIVYGSNLTGSVDGSITSFLGNELAVTIFCTGLGTAVAYSDDMSTSGAGATITNMRGFTANSIVSSGDTVTAFSGFYSAQQVAGTVTDFYGGYFAPNVTGSGNVTNLYGVYIAPQNSGTVTNLYGLFQAGANVINQFEGQLVSVLSPVASQPAALFTGTWFTGGDSTTTKPLVLIEPSGTPSSNWNISGTAIGVNANIAFAGNLVDLQVNGASYFRVDNLGSAIVSRLVDARVGDVSSSWTDGGSQVLQDNSWTVINTNTSPITSFTLFMSPNPIDGEQCIIVTAGAVAVFTLDGNGHTVNNAPGALVADTSTAFEFLGGIWYRLY